MNKIIKFFVRRLIFVCLSILIQIAVLVVLIWKFSNYFVYFYALFEIISLFAVFWIMNGKSNPYYKLAWIIPIMAFPIFGGLFYIMFGGNNINKKDKKKMENVYNKMNTLLKQDLSILEDIKTQSKDIYNQIRYITSYSLCPVYKNTMTKYLSPGEVKFKYVIEELKKAEHYIFLEYFIIQEGIMWNTILDILKEKVKSGVDVRVVYDDVGCVATLPYKYDEKLNKLGIKCFAFNPFKHILSPKLNNRDHRKILIIDGHTAFTGGINLADEYINAYEKHGHWKDASIMLKGDAVWNLTVMFLSLWEYTSYENKDFNEYKTEKYINFDCKNDGYVLPFSDSPIDNETIGENVYMNIINKAKDYVYINTPYLVLDNEMTTALCNAAKSGIDIKIVTPFIYDKWFVHAVSRSNYKVLIESGVEIYEYTPGFIHSKTFVSDDEIGVVGTINLDFRSFYLHFECGVFLYKTSTIAEIKNDYLETLKLCHKITLEECKNIKLHIRIIRSILKMFAPLM